MQIRFFTNSYNMSQDVLVPLAQKDIALSDAEPGGIQIHFQSLKLRLGAVETIFEIVGVLTVAAGITEKVTSSLLSNWIWSVITRQQSKQLNQPQPQNELHVEITRPDGTHIAIDIRTPESLNASLKSLQKLNAP